MAIKTMILAGHGSGQQAKALSACWHPVAANHFTPFRTSTPRGCGPGGEVAVKTCHPSFSTILVGHDSGQQAKALFACWHPMAANHFLLFRASLPRSTWWCASSGKSSRSIEFGSTLFLTTCLAIVSFVAQSTTLFHQARGSAVLISLEALPSCSTFLPSPTAHHF